MTEEQKKVFNFIYGELIHIGEFDLYNDKRMLISGGNRNFYIKTVVELEKQGLFTFRTNIYGTKKRENTNYINDDEYIHMGGFWVASTPKGKKTYLEGNDPAYIIGLKSLKLTKRNYIVSIIVLIVAIATLLVSIFHK